MRGERIELKEASPFGSSSDPFVLYCLIRRWAKDKGPIQFLLMEKHGYLTFPPTKFRPGEDLYQALMRPMGEALSLPRDSYFHERELGKIPSEGASPRYPGLPKAAASGELAGVGKGGIAGKTVCECCNVHKQCTLHPLMVELLLLMMDS